jgi:hypothetical protein
MSAVGIFGICAGEDVNIADLAGSDVIGPAQIAEAVQLRRAAAAF